MPKILFALFFFLTLFSPLGAQTAARSQIPDMVLVFADDESVISITGQDGKVLPAELGMSLPAGATIRTNGSSAELQLVPNGTIVKLTAKTVFKVESVQGRDRGGANSFALVTGKLRTVAARLSGGPTAYTIRTPTAAGAVRGTDFAMLSEPGLKDWICVQEGVVEFKKLDAVTGEELGTLEIKAGEFADTFSETFSALPVTQQRLQEIFSDLNFQKLDPSAVPGSKAVAATPAAPAAPTEETPADAAPVASAPAGGAVPPADGAAPGDTTESAPAPKGKDPLMALVSEYLGGFQAGSITIDGITYAKAVIQPKIHTDGFKIGFYLPIIYTSDLFDPNDWYKPKKNSEWSFGFDQTNWVDGVVDGFQDIMLKIRYLEVGRQGKDPFFLKVGNLNGLYLGHGSLIRNFANDQDFPAIRRLGLNTGIKAGDFESEGLFDDLGDLQVLGLRAAMGFGMFQIGLSGAADLNVARNADVTGSWGHYGRPALIAAGLDLRLFQLDIGVLSALGYTDVGTILTYFQEKASNSLSARTVDQGLNINTAFADGQIKNLLWTVGVSGKAALLVDYVLEFRFTKGLAKVGLFDATYNRTKLAYLDQVMGYLDGSTTATVDKTSSVGVYGSAGADILGILQFKAGYYWPWAFDGSSFQVGEDDSLEMVLTIPKGKLPVINAYGSLVYQRTRFAKTIGDAITGKSAAGVNLFDSNTVFGGELAYGLLEGMDLAITVSTLVIRDETTGEVKYENGQPMIRPSINIETRISF